MVLAACGGGGGASSEAPSGGVVAAPLPQPLPQPASIVTQPSDASVAEGGATSFTVTALNAASFQWQSSRSLGGRWADLAAANDARYTTPASTTAMHGSLYRVLVRGAGGDSVLSSAVTLSVTPTLQAAAVLMAPASVSVVALASDGLRLRAVASNAQGSTTSAAARLSVSLQGVAPSFNPQPADTLVLASASALLSVNVGGTPRPTLQWQTAGASGDFVNINGATFSDYSAPPLAADGAARRYRVVASNSAGQPFTLSAVVAGQPVPTLQWYVSTSGLAVAIAGATATAYTAPAMAAGDRRSYSVRAANAVGIAWPGVFVSAGNAYIDANDQLLNAAAVAGGPALIQRALSEFGSGEQPIGLPAASLQWQTRSDASAAWTDIPGATGYALAWPVAALADNGRQVRHRATNIAGSVASGVSTLRVEGQAVGPSWEATSTSRIVHTEEVGMSAIKGRQWLGVPYLPGGAPTPEVTISSSRDGGASWQPWSYRVPAITAADEGRLFRLSASNSTGNSASTAITLPIRLRLAGHSRNPVQWQTWPEDTEVVEGALASFRASASMLGVAESSQWQVSGDGGVSWQAATAQAGSQLTPETLQTLPVSLQDNGKQYRFQFSLAGRSYTSGPGRLTVRAAPAARLDLLAGSPGGFGTLDGDLRQARFSQPLAITRDPTGHVYLIDDTRDLLRLRQITPQGEVRTLYAAAMGMVTPAPYSGGSRIDGNQSLSAVAAAADGSLYVAEATRIWRRAPGAASVSLLAGGGSGDGSGAAAGFTGISALAVGPDGALTVAEGGGAAANCLRRVSANGVVTTLAGSFGTAAGAGLQDGPTAMARFRSPMGVAVDSNGDVYVADAGNHRLRKPAPDGMVSTVTGFLPGDVGPLIVQSHGTLATARLYAPRAVAMLAPGVIAVSGSGRVRLVVPAADSVITLAGAGPDSSADGAPGQAGFS